LKTRVLGWLPLRTLGAICAAAAICCAGCALTAPAPGGALREGGFLQVQPTWAMSYAPGGATVHATSPGVRGNGGAISGNTQSLGGDPSLAAFGAVLPISLAVRQSIGRAVEVAVDGGWFDSGVELRSGVPDASARLPVVFSIGARASRFGLLPPKEQTYQFRLRAEAYPRLHPAVNDSARGVLALGVSAGSFLHDMGIPAPPDPNPPEIGSGPPHVLFVRPEVRVECFLGIQARGRHAHWLVGVAPWIVVANGTARTETNSDWAVDAFSQQVGTSLVASVGLGGDPWTSSAGPSAFSR
jgi:hypothetical protein